jgi:hypothetical protein
VPRVGVHMVSVRRFLTRAFTPCYGGSWLGARKALPMLTDANA